MAIRIRRRELLAALGGAAVWPLAARAQHAAMPVIGFLSSSSSILATKRIASFSQGLSEAGYVASRNVTIEQRLAEGQYERLAELAAELVSRRVQLIAALASAAAFAAKKATTTIPIVFVGALDPVQAGLVASLSRPGGNVTGVTFISASLGAKRLELAREVVRNAGVIGVLTHPNSPSGQEELRDLQSAAKAVGQELFVIPATTENDIEAAFPSFVQQHIGVLIVGSDPFIFQQNAQLITLAARYRIPTVYPAGESISQGGLVSYGASIPDAWRLAGVYAGRILKGERPAELPVVQPTKIELAINLKTAKALGLTVPPSLLARADEVIE